MAASIVDSCEGYACDLNDILEYRDTRIPKDFGCCTLDASSLAYFYFNLEGCSNYEMTNDEIKQLNGNSDTCDLWRDLCPSTACGNGSLDFVYSPYFEKCVDTTCPTNEPTPFPIEDLGSSTTSGGFSTSKWTTSRTSSGHRKRNRGKGKKKHGN